MEFNYRFKRNMLRAISANISSTCSGSYYYGSSIEHNNIFNVFITFSLEGNIIEVPSVYRNEVINALNKNLSAHNPTNYKRMVIPTYVFNDRVEIKRTADALITRLFSSNYSLMKVIDGKNNVYYGCAGLIMDKDFKPLFMSTINIDCSQIKERNKFLITQLNIRINPTIFDSSNTLEKMIIKKLIWLYSNNSSDSLSSISLRESRGMIGLYDTRENNTAKIIIEPFDNFFATPNTPDFKTCNDDILNDIVINNIKEITKIT